MTRKEELFFTLSVLFLSENSQNMQIMSDKEKKPVLEFLFLSSDEALELPIAICQP